MGLAGYAFGIFLVGTLFHSRSTAFEADHAFGNLVRRKNVPTITFDAGRGMRKYQSPLCKLSVEHLES